MRHNRLRALLNAGEPTVGTHLLSTWPTLVELIGQAGHYDYVEFTAEYAPFDLHDLDNLGRALDLMNLAGMIKVEQTQWTHQAMRAIGSGFQSVLFADVRTEADARACVAAVILICFKRTPASRTAVYRALCVPTTTGKRTSCAAICSANV